MIIIEESSEKNSCDLNRFVENGWKKFTKFIDFYTIYCQDKIKSKCQKVIYKYE